MTPTTLMVRLASGNSNDAILRFAADLATRLEAVQLIGISACQPVPIYVTPYTYVPQDILGRDREQMERELEATRDHFHAVLRGKVAKLEWRSTVTYGPLADYVAEQMRAADLLISPSQERSSVFDITRQLDVADLVLRAGRPVLVVGTGIDSLDLRSVVIGWKDTREARRTLEDALPLLKRADRVTVVELAANKELPEARIRTEDVPNWLARHGIAASSRADASLGDDATQLSGIARELDAGMLVGGAYGHTRLREWVLGGVTRDLLLCPSRCALVAH
jgi:nucleotide-binding universal stress UspA family protein